MVRLAWERTGLLVAVLVLAGAVVAVVVDWWLDESIRREVGTWSSI